MKTQTETDTMNKGPRKLQLADAEITAMRRIVKVLELIEPATQSRIACWLADRFDVPGHDTEKV